MAAEPLPIAPIALKKQAFVKMKKLISLSDHLQLAKKTLSEKDYRFLSDQFVEFPKSTRMPKLDLSEDQFHIQMDARGINVPFKVIDIEEMVFELNNKKIILKDKDFQEQWNIIYSTLPTYALHKRSLFFPEVHAMAPLVAALLALLAINTVTTLAKAYVEYKFDDIETKCNEARDENKRFDDQQKILREAQSLIRHNIDYAVFPSCANFKDKRTYPNLDKIHPEKFQHCQKLRRIDSCLSQVLARHKQKYPQPESVEKSATSK